MKLKKLVKKASFWAMKAVPVIVPMLMVMHANSTASSINGQSTPPESLKHYRKF